MLYTEFKSYGVKTIDGWLHKKRKMDIGYNYSVPTVKTKIDIEKLCESLSSDQSLKNKTEE